VDEAKGFYALYGASDKLEWITGPGGHGNLGPISPQILAFFTKNLKGAEPDPAFTTIRAALTTDMIVTPTGQVSTSIGGETVYSLNRQRAATVIPKPLVLNGKSDVQKLQNRLGEEIRSLTGATVKPGSLDSVVALKESRQREGYRFQVLSLASDGGTETPGALAVPDGKKPKGAFLIMDSQPVGDELVSVLATAGNIVMAIQSRPSPVGTESIKSPYLGSFNLLSLRAFLVGKTVLGLRLDDTIRAVNYLASRSDVDRNKIVVAARGPLAMAALHAAALDTRISRVVVTEMLASYRMIVDQPVHRSVSEVVIPGVLRHYDTADLIEAVYPRPVVIVSPQDALGAAISDKDFRDALPQVFQSEQKLGSSQRVRLIAAGDWRIALGLD
jgi:hypothetical protein